MGNNTHTIEINAVLKTTLGNVDSTIKELQNKLRSGDLQIDLTKGVGKDLSKLVSNFETSFSKINQMTPDNLLNILDSKEFQKEGTSIIKTIQEIQRIVNDVGTKSMIDAKKLFPNAFDGRVTELQGLIQNVSTSLESLTKKEATFNKLNTEIAGLTAKIQELDEAAANQGKLEEEWNRATKAVEATNTAVDNLRENLRGQLELKIQQNSVDKTEQKIEELNKELEEFTNKGVTVGKGGRGVFQGKGIGDWEKIAKNGTTEEKAQAQAALELLRNYNNVNSALKEQKTLLEDVKKAQELLNQSPQLSDNKSLKEAGSILGQKEEVTNALEQQTNATNRATQAQLKLAQAENASAQKQELQQQINQKTQRLNELDAAIKNLRTNTDLGTLTQKFNELTGLNLAPIKENLQIMLKKLREIDNTSYENLKGQLQKLGIVLPETKQDVDNLRQSFHQTGTTVKEFNNRLGEVEQLKTRMAYFFGLTNSIQLFRRAVTQALNTVKELDKTMTEAAVVTDFSVGDMWEKLPQYSQEAQKLGISINGMYQATTLYYQQGLKTNEAMALGTETMKMGKIAAMDSTEATKAMTAALRGFNMELNETSATRVNDVYSQLAAVTAADTNQIATAMEKTASIAASANMEFETTAALLAQIIETTQEAPETAGTALKTIIARFSEVKSLREQGLTSGKDEEGEAIDVNKIQAALRTVGISMEGFFAGTEGLDSILLKLAEKWEHLDFETQRYIATMAAGSRQQSRFIAMMSDYGRTVELVGEAQDSAGASQRQFEKTQESLETALARLSNAWNQFLMGLANNEVLKTAINSLTTLIETLNKLLTFVSGGSGGLKSVVSLLTTIATLKMGRGLLGMLGGGSLIGQLFGGKNAKQQGAKSAKSFFGSFKSGLKGLFTTKTMDELNLSKAKSQILDVDYTGLDDGTKAAIGNAKSYEELTNVTEQYNKTARKTNGTVIDLDKSVTESTAEFEKNQVSLQKTQATLSGVATASMAAGMAVGLLGGLFESLGWEEGAKAAEYLSYGLTAVGLASTLASAAVNLFKISALKALGVAAMVGAAIMAVILVISIFVSSSNEFEKEAENAATAAEVAANAAKEAKQAYDELLSGHQDYDELQKGLEDLVQGTNEWRDALLAANDQVLELLKTYPELYQYLGTGKYGQLTITEEGWQEAERLALEKRERTSASLAAANLRVTQANFTKVQQEMYDELKMTVEEFYALVEQVSQGNTDSLEAIDDEKLQKKVIEYVQFAQKTKAQMDAQGKALLSTSASDELLGYDFSQALFSGASSNYNTYKGITGTDWHIALGGQAAEQKELLDYYGIMEKELADLDGLERAQHIYKKVMNVDEIDEKIAKNEDELLKAVAQVYATEQSQGILEELAKNLSKKDKATQGKLATILSGDTGFASLAAQKDFSGLELTDFLEDIGMESEELAAYWGVDVNQLEDTFESYKTEINEAYENVFSDPELYGMGDSLRDQIDALNTIIMGQGHETGLDLGQTEVLAQSMAKVAVNGGDTAELFGQLSTIFAGLSGSDLEEAVSILSNVDWTSKDDIDRAIDSLRGFGIAIENDVVKGLYKAAKAMRAFNAATVEAKLEKLAEVDDILSEKAEDGSSTYTADQMKKLVEQGLGVDQFVRVGYDEYVLMEPIDNLRKALDENTSALLEESITDAKESLAIAENYEKLINSEEKGYRNSMGGGKEEIGTYGEILSKIIDGSLSSSAIYSDTLQGMANMLGLDTFGLTTEQVFGLIKENYSHYENRVATQGSLNQLEADAATMSAYSKIGSIDFNEEEEGASAALDAYIQQENLAFVVDKAAEALKRENYELRVNKMTIQNLVAGNHKTMKSIKQLTDTINDQSEALQIGNLNNLEYQQALTKVADQASEVFGVDVNEEFVHQYRDLFTQWAEGGSGAQVAYEELGKKAAESYIAGLEDGSEKIPQVMNAIEAGIDPSIEVGVAFDISDLFAKLETILGSAEEAAKVLQAMGYSVSFKTMYVNSNYPGAPFDKIIPAFSGEWTEVQVPIAMKTDAGGGYKGGGGGGSNNYENGYDRLHNILQEINDTLRERERLERQYQRLLNQNLATAEQLSVISQQNIAGYQFEISKQKDVIAGRLAQIEGEKLGNPDLQDLIYTETGRDGEQSIRINWEGLQAIKNADAGERTDEYYDRIQGWLESIYEAQTAIEEAQDAIYEEMLQGKDEYLELEEQIKEAIINERQKWIDERSAIYDSINDTNSKLLESMQQQLDEYRKNRDNAKTEDELADKQRRLAYLQQDTSGANAKEILQLQKEIEEGTESYTDRLIDQKISELQQQNDKAAEQRQQQIDILQATLDKEIESGELWKEVGDLIKQGTSMSGGLTGERLETILKSSIGFKGMSEIQQMDWLNETNNLIASALKWLASDKAVKKEGAEIKFKIVYEDGKESEELIGTVNKRGQVETENGIFNKVVMNANGEYKTFESLEEASKNKSQADRDSTKPEEIAMFPYGKPSQLSKQPEGSEHSGLIKALQHALNIASDGKSALTVDGTWGQKTSGATYTYTSGDSWSDRMSNLEAEVKKKFEKLKNDGKINLSQFKTGGLADFTGPAWLDGTKSRPEYILNADQTKAFFNLVDVLGSLQTSSFKTAQNSGDNTYDIDINVESIGSDYDVEQLATTVKRLINEDARYRNNNTINLMR